VEVFFLSFLSFTPPVVERVINVMYSIVEFFLFFSGKNVDDDRRGSESGREIIIPCRCQAAVLSREKSEESTVHCMM
jgi:hypothetical protein